MLVVNGPRKRKVGVQLMGLQDGQVLQWMIREAPDQTALRTTVVVVCAIDL